jgi:diguanylate cyclase (GGDEF)-like protein
VATSLGIALGNTLEAVAGAYLVNRFAQGWAAFEDPDRFVKFTVLAAGLSTAISPTIGITTLALGGFASWADFGRIWMTWWLGDAVGALVVAPCVLLWIAKPLTGWPRERLVEAWALFACVLATGGLVFGGFFPSQVQNYPLEFLCLPPLLWAAMRFGPREASTSVLFLSVVAVLGTLLGYGPFVRATEQESLFLLQAYSGVAAITTLSMAAVVSQRRTLESQLRHLSVTDPLTGIANYRLLIQRLTAEIIRTQRTGRQFTVLLLDVDNLKKINDRHGHLVGSRALCRVADVLRRSCRATDTPARYGGDEFALVLPEADKAAAQQIATRLLQRLARDAEQPPLTVSLGVATYPFHGETPEQLLEAADQLLYAMKTSGRGESLAPRE